MTAARLIAILLVAAAPFAGARGDDAMAPQDRLGAGDSGGIEGQMIDRAVRFRSTTFAVSAQVAARCGVSTDVTGGHLAAFGVDCSSGVGCLATVAVVPSRDAGARPPAGGRRSLCGLEGGGYLIAAADMPMTVLIDF